jgi:hypothetical protein
MADNTQKVGVEVEVKGAEKSISSIKDLKTAIKQARDEQVKMSESFGEGSEEYVKASKRLAELKDKVEDLNDSTQSLKGTGVESLSSSFGLLGDGLKNLDLDKIKTGFKGVGQAMSAIPLLLLVSGITMLAEKFGIFEMITDAVVQVIYAFTDAIGLTNKADEKASAQMIENAQNVQKVKEEQYNAEIKKAQAAGQSVSELEVQKLKAIEDSIASQLQSLENLQVKKGELNDEEQKQYNELQVNLLKASGDREAKEIQNNKEKNDRINAYNLLSANASEELRVAKLSEREKEIDAIRKQSATKLSELNKKQSVDSEAEYKALAKTEAEINEVAQIEINKINAKYNAEANEKRKAEEKKIQDEINDDIIKSNEIRFANIKAQEENAAAEKKQKAIDDAKELNDELNALSLDAANDSASIVQSDFDLKKELGKQNLENFKNDQQAQLDVSRQSLQSVQNVSDLFFSIKSAKLKKGSAEELALAKKQFNVNKALQLGLAVIDGYKAVTTSLASAPVAVGPVPNPAGIASLAFAVTTSLANIAKIAASKFEGGGGAPSTGGSPSAGGASIPAPPTISNQNANVEGTQFDENGKRIGSKNDNTINVVATVGVDEITAKTNRVNVLEKQSTF